MPLALINSSHTKNSNYEIFSKGISLKTKIPSKTNQSVFQALKTVSDSPICCLEHEGKCTLLVVGGHWCGCPPFHQGFGRTCCLVWHCSEGWFQDSHDALGNHTYVACLALNLGGWWSHCVPWAIVVRILCRLRLVREGNGSLP